jgi:hypothetical protein
MKMCPDCGVDIPALNIRCDPCHWKWYGAHVGGQAPTAQPASVPEADCPCWYTPEWCEACIATMGAEANANANAQRILDLGRTQPTPAPRVVDQRAEGVARAVANLTRQDDAFMPAASRWEP